MISKTLCSFLRCNQRHPDQHSYLTEDAEYTLGRGTFFVGERKADVLQDVRWITLNSILSLRRTLHPRHRDTSILPNDIKRTVAQGLIFGARGHGKSRTVNLNITSEVQDRKYQSDDLMQLCYGHVDLIQNVTYVRVYMQHTRIYIHMCNTHICYIYFLFLFFSTYKRIYM